jgi:FKBP-type peptidyl-prolyl cis-trans isomerase FkpA
MVVALGIPWAVVPGCSDSPTAPTHYAPFSVTDLRVGTGTAAVVGSTLTVHYTGWLYDSTQPEHKGVQFDTSADRDAFTFTLGAGTVIKGWDQGLVGMQAGGLRQLVIPPSLGYGSSRFGPIPPNATLLFEIELLIVE